MKKGLKRYFVISFILGLVTFFFLFNFVGAQGSGTIVSGGLVPCGTGNDAGAAQDCGFQDLVKLADKIVKFLVTVSTFVFVAIIVYAGWLYVSSNGDTGKVAQAHKMFFNSVVGLFIVLAAWLLIDMLLKGLKVNDELQNVLGITELWIS